MSKKRNTDHKEQRSKQEAKEEGKRLRRTDGAPKAQSESLPRPTSALFSPLIFLWFFVEIDLLTARRNVQARAD